MSDETTVVPDTNDPWYVHETITDSESEGAPYQAYYGPYSRDYANQFAADLETRFHDREAARTNPDGPAPSPSTRSQSLEVVAADQFDTTAQANLQPDEEAPATAPAAAPDATAPAAAPDATAPAAAPDATAPATAPPAA